MQFSKLLSKGVALSALASFVTAAFDANSNENVVVYWGQASAGSQENLAYYCDSDDVDIVVLSFVTSFPGTNDVPTLNFASACYETFDNGLLKCTQIGTDIKTCQSNGKKILLSLGGASGSYGFSSDSEAETFAGTLWDLFGEGSSDTRPFGESVVDGFDFDIENADPTGYAALATKLREYFSSGSKDYYLSAAPQCVYPDASVGDLLENADIDFAFVQFYNNYCNVDKDFNWDTWTDYAANTSPNKDIKIYLGLPGSSSAAGSGYIDISTVESTLKTIESDSAFGGVMLWDASQSFTNKVDGETYVGAIKDALESLGGSSETSAATSSKVSSSKTTSTATTSEVSISSIQSENKEVSSLAGHSSSTSVTSSAPVSSSTTVASSSTQASESVSFPSVSTEPNTVSPVSKSSSTLVASSSTSTPVVASSSTSTPVVASSSTSASAIVSSAEATPAGPSSQSAPAGPSSQPTPAGPSSQSAPAGPSSQQTPAAPSSEATEATTSSPPFSEVTSNTFPTGPSTLSSVLVSTTEGQQTTTFSLSNVIDPTTSSTTASSAAPSASGSSDCSSLTGLAKARCLNQAYSAGEFNGETSDCTHGSIACSASGEYAVCNWGSWVTFQCAAGTTCYAYNQGDEVFTGCNYSSQESQFTKRSVDHAHHQH